MDEYGAADIIDRHKAVADVAVEHDAEGLDHRHGQELQRSDLSNQNSETAILSEHQRLL